MNNPDSIFPMTEQEILEHFPHVFNNQFQSRSIVQGNVWNVHCPLTMHHNWSWYGSSYSKGESTRAILINKQGEKDVVEFWKQYKHGKVQYCYSIKKRELFQTILN